MGADGASAPMLLRRPRDAGRETPTGGPAGSGPNSTPTAPRSGAPARGGLLQPEHSAGRTRARSAASTLGSPAGRSRTPPTGERLDDGGRGVLPGPRRGRAPVRPRNGRPEILAGYPAIAAAARRSRSGQADLAARSSPPATGRPRRHGRGVESDEIAIERGRLDAAVAGLLFMAGIEADVVSAAVAARTARRFDVADGRGEPAVDSQLRSLARSATVTARAAMRPSTVIMPSVLRGCVRAPPHAPRAGRGVRPPAAGADAVRGPRSASGSPGPVRPGAAPTRRPAASPRPGRPPRPRRRGRCLTASSRRAMPAQGTRPRPGVAHA